VDGEPLDRPSQGIALRDDHGSHRVRVVLGAANVDLERGTAAAPAPGAR